MQILETRIQLTRFNLVCANGSPLSSALLHFVCDHVPFPLSFGETHPFNRISYFVHSFFSIIFPAHFLYLLLTTKHTPGALWRGLMHAMKTHIPRTHTPGDRVTLRRPFPMKGFTTLVLLLTAGVTVPALCWFVAVTLAPYVLPLLPMN